MDRRLGDSDWLGFPGEDRPEGTEGFCFDLRGENTGQSRMGVGDRQQENL